MSILLRNKETLEVVSYAKGSDQAIKDRIGEMGQDQKNLFKDVNIFASRGLRTLVFAHKQIIEAEAGGLLEDMEANDVEQNYSLIGITGVEDTLQDNVIECIRDFKTAKIKVWMLTGDKKETANNIALTCEVITQSNKVCYVDESSVREDLQEALGTIKQAANKQKHDGFGFGQ